MFELIKAALYGLVEGITEWLPISSTGHMLLLNQIMPLGVSQDFWDMFLVVIQLGAILAVCLLYFRSLNPFSHTKTPEKRKATWRLWAQIIVACIPAAAIGIPLDDWMEAHLGSPFVIAGALIFYGIIFIVIETLRERTSTMQTTLQAGRHFARSASTGRANKQAAIASDTGARVVDIEHMPWKTALGIGAFQVLSIIPGTSRSGSTIIGGLILGCSRAVAAEFTFYLAIPVMFGASALRLVKFFLKGNMFSPVEVQILLAGCIVAFVVSLLVIRFFMAFIRKHDFKPFGWYRIALGIVVIIWFGLLH